jgi:hypothetical protein
MIAAAALYLDTARLGRMSKGAQWAVRDFARLAGEAALTLYGKNFLFDGYEILPDRLKRRCGGLRSWRGIESLKRELLTLVAARPDRDCVLASRSLTILRLGAQLLSQRSKRILFPDLAWPPYASLVSAAIKQQGGKTIDIRLRAAVFSEQLSETEVIERIATVYSRARCDGAFLTAVTHDGVRLPVDRIIERLRIISPLSFVVVDASQAIGHVPDELGIQQADLVVAGVHKWLRAGLPMGVGFGSHAAIADIRKALYSDPLLALTSRSRVRAREVNETVNVWPLFSCHAAVGELFPARDRLARSFAWQLQNAASVNRMLSESRWAPLMPHASMRSGIVLARHRNGKRCVRDADYWRRLFESFGVHLTTYPGSLVRLSLLGRCLDESEWLRLGAAFFDNGRIQRLMEAGISERVRFEARL